jgi:putative endonuclease
VSRSERRPSALLTRSPGSGSTRHQPASVNGRSAEQAVAAWLVTQGFDIVATNLRVGHYELDVVARSGPLIVVVEVRSRGARAWTTGFGSLDAGKRRRIRLAGERLWQRRYRHDSSAERLRFDAASVTFRDGEPHIEYAPAAF